MAGKRSFPAASRKLGYHCAAPITGGCQCRSSNLIPSAGHRFEKFDSIPEWVSHIRPIVASQRLVRIDRISRVLAPLDQLLESDHEQRRVRLLRRPEVILDAKVHLRFARTEPRSASLNEIRWLRLFVHSQNVSIERSRVFLSARGHCKLDVVNCSDHLRHLTSKAKPLRPTR